MKRKSNRRILVVDDQPNVGRVIGELLRREGHDCTVVLRGVDAIAEMQREPVAVLLADLMMPGMTGLELLQATKRQWPDTRLVLFTGQESSPVVHEAHRLGARFLIKGGRSYEILMIVDSELEAFAAREANGHERG
jgi:CheY-like chemotaxis protein